MPSTIRLTINNDLRVALEFLNKRYPLLSYDEIMKLAFSKFYTEELGLQNISIEDTFNRMRSQNSNVKLENEADMSEWWSKNKKALFSENEESSN